MHRNTTAQNMNLQPRWMSEPASEGRVRFITSLLAERAVPSDAADRLRAEIANGTLITSKAIDAIEWLKGRDRVAVVQARTQIVNGELAPAFRKTEVTITETGFYLFEDEAFKVVRTKDGLRFYAERATASGWDYESAKGVVYKLEPEMLMTAMDIAKFGQARQFCVNCSHGLSDPISKVVGLGTSCGPDILGKDGYKEAKAHAIATNEAAARHDAEQKAGAKARREAKKAQNAASAA